MARFSSVSFARLLLSATGVLAGLTVDVSDTASVKAAAALVAEDLMSFYTGEIPGLLPGPPPDGGYYQWTGGALWTAMLDYRSRTGDTQYDDKISQGLLWQRGPNNDFLSPNWTASEGNDDQAIWGMAALLAVETDFTAPGVDNLTYATLAQNVLDELSTPSRRVENGSCAGGLRWQIYLVNTGYNYVSTLANVAYANLAARLSLQDGNNETQADSVDDTFSFLQTTGLIDSKFDVFDGAQSINCNEINKLQSSIAAALALESAAAMFNSTQGNQKWKTILDGLTQQTLDVFFPSGVAKEIACEPANCNTDMTFFKSFLHRSLASAMTLAPYTADKILPVLKTSAAAAAASCTGGDNDRMCGLVWSGKSNGQIGAGQQMSVLSALLSLLPTETVAKSSGSGTGTGSGNGTSSTTTPTGSSSSPSSTVGNAGAQTGVSAFVLIGSLLLTNLLFN
ncbi:glycosyl hydrolase family 76-domain-containing protein [Hypoxylon argillaceum]|nr:glycosyl hydrolase family 76-domain-containing protein [Hypoxylon argillaceum]